MSKKRVWVVSILMVCFAASVALAQQKVPPPKPPDDGPSLADTMQFIQDKLNGVGALNFAAYYHDNTTGQDWVNQFKEEVSNARANPATCIVSYHYKGEVNGALTVDRDAGIPLKAVENIMVMTREQAFKEGDAEHGHPTWSARVDPPVFVLNAVKSKNGGSNVLDFLNEDMANRLAKAMVHAVELCGGGNKDPF